MKQLKELAKTINVNCVRTGFDIVTEQTKFVCIINGISFDFSCGLRACVPEKIRVAGLGEVCPWKRLRRQYEKLSYCNNFDRIFDKIMQGSVKAAQNTDRPHVMRVFNDISMLCQPTAYDLLYCLKLDADAINESFENWCSNFGYDSDSIKALKTYNACTENAHKLRIALGNELYKEVMESEDE